MTAVITSLSDEFSTLETAYSSVSLCRNLTLFTFATQVNVYRTVVTWLVLSVMSTKLSSLLGALEALEGASLKCLVRVCNIYLSIKVIESKSN